MKLIPKSKPGRVIGVVVGVFIGLAIIGAIVGGGSSNKTSTTGAGASATPQKVPEAKSHIILDARKVSGGAANSWCVPDPANAQMTFYYTLRNTGGKDGKTNVVPWRRYNDASINDGIGDETVDIPVPAHGVRRGNTVVPFDALKHDVIECRIVLGSDFEHPTKIPVI